MYYIIMDQSTKHPSVIENDHGFLEDFANYESAKKEAEEWKKNGDCDEYMIVGHCTDQRNHII